MMRRNSGHIVNISSVAGVIGVFGYTAYSASKFAVLGLSDALRVEMKPHGIGVSVVIPNDTDTPQLQEERALQPLETKITEGIVKPERLQRPSEYLAYWLVRLMNDAGNPLDAEQVARAILRGIRKEKYLIIPDPAFGIAYHLRGLVAPLAHWAFDQLVPVARRQTQAD
jgi:3-dehydrosphinganine reductase